VLESMSIRSANSIEIIKMIVVKRINIEDEWVCVVYERVVVEDLSGLVYTKFYKERLLSINNRAKQK
jgi:hypothetical protein